MRRSRIIVLVIALAAGAIAAMLASGNRTPEVPKVAEPPPLATTDVLVAKTDLNTGQVVSEGGVGWQIWPAAAASSALVRKSDRPDAIKEFVGALVRSPTAAGEPIRNSKVVLAKGGGSWLPFSRTACARSRSTIADNDAGGFILPNDHVDVILTRRDKWAEKTADVKKNTSAKRSCGTCGCSRSTSRSKKRTARRSLSARPPPSNLIRSKPKRWRSRVRSARSP